MFKVFLLNSKYKNKVQKSRDMYRVVLLKIQFEKIFLNPQN